tara:strand:- start:187 stop:519 length:333 start_codon:yes stop_codon:yes gene_type:complete
MANTFKNEVKDLTTSNQDILAAAEVTGTGIVLTIRCTNVDGTNDATVDIEVVKASSGGNSYIAKTMTVPADSSLELAGTSKIVLEAGDKIQGLASAASDVEVFLSWLHIT